MVKCTSRATITAALQVEVTKHHDTGKLGNKFVDEYEIEAGLEGWYNIDLPIRLTEERDDGELGRFFPRAVLVPGV